jgi:hypothetical protein
VAADFKLVSQMGLKETGILTSASDYHIFLKRGRAVAGPGAYSTSSCIARQRRSPARPLRRHHAGDFVGFVLP